MSKDLQKIFLILLFFSFVFFVSHIHASTISISDTVSVSATVTGGPNQNPVHTGGGGPTYYPNTGVFISGTAYPFSKITVLKDGQFALGTTADGLGNFSLNLGNLSTGNYTFSLIAEDKNGLKSNPFTFQMFINSGVTTSIHDIIIGPTIGLNKTVVKRGDSILIFGQSIPLGNVVITLNSLKDIFTSAPSDSRGVYQNNFDTSNLAPGRYTAKSKSIKNGLISPSSKVVRFTIADQNAVPTNKIGLERCDLNQDGRCNLVDFSIAAFWYKRPFSKEFAEREKKYLNGDGKIDLVDFSIMAYYWTG